MTMSKKTLFCLLAASALTLGAAPRELKVLTVGNSFTWSLRAFLPPVAAAGGVKLKLEFANIGGCTMERHWREHLKSEKDPSHLPYSGKYTLRQLLAKEKWDIVTIQQASPASWRAATYHPFAENLIGLIRELAPTAEIVIQETWSYNAAAPYFAKWGIDSATMYRRLTENYRALAAQHGLRVIPAGYAVDLFRRTMGDRLVARDPADPSQLQEPAVPRTTDVVGNFRWQEDKKTGKRVLRQDLIHLNPRGQYLQALVWYGFLFGADPEQSTYEPKGISAEEIALFKRCAKQAIAEFPQVRRGEK